MPNNHDLDLLVRGALLALFLASIWIYWRDQRHTYGGQIMAALCAAGFAHFVTTMPDLLGKTSPLLFALQILGGLSSGLLWQLSRVWFGDETRLGSVSRGLVLAPALIDAFVMLAGLGQHPWTLRLWVPLEQAIWLFFGLASIWIAWHNRNNDLIELRRKFRTVIVASAAGLAILASLVEFVAPRAGQPDQLHALVLITNGLAAVFIISLTMGVRQADIFAQIRPLGRKLDAGEVDDPLVHSLLAKVIAEKSWRDENLTIAQFAAQLGEQEYRLRRAINGALGFRNFAQFLNEYRLGEVKSALVDPAQAEVPIVTIALDAGFGSLRSFNRTFREAEGVTPSEYRQQSPG